MVNQADDKIIAVLNGRPGLRPYQEYERCPAALVDRLKHYFLSYKQLPGDVPRRVEIVESYDREEALDVIRRSIRDYKRSLARPAGELRKL